MPSSVAGLPFAIRSAMPRPSPPRMIQPAPTFRLYPHGSGMYTILDECRRPAGAPPPPLPPCICRGPVGALAAVDATTLTGVAAVHKMPLYFRGSIRFSEIQALTPFVPAVQFSWWCFHAAICQRWRRLAQKTCAALPRRCRGWTKQCLCRLSHSAPPPTRCTCHAPTV